MLDKRDKAPESALVNEENRVQRYPGLHAYGDHPLDAALFFGRDTEARQVENRIRAERCLVMFGRSGVGKSSLLKAAVFPELRRQGFFPFEIHLTEAVADPEEAVRDALKDDCRANPKVDLVTGDASSGLWLFFRTSDIWCGEGLLTPVLVFDQFEDIFTRHDAAFRTALAGQLRDLVDTQPMHLIHRLRAAGKAGHFESDAAIDLRVVFSLREEYLAGLEELALWLPSLFDQRLRLLPPGRPAAEQAILRPAAMDAEQVPGRLRQMGEDPQGLNAERLDDWLHRSAQFGFTDGALAMLLDVLVDDRNEIDLTLLQTLCRNIEERVPKISGPGFRFTVDKEFLGSQKELRRVLQGYYRNALGVVLDQRQPRSKEPGISPQGSHLTRQSDPLSLLWRGGRRLVPFNQRHAARMLCEIGLISDKGNRISLVDENAKSEFGVDETTLTVLQRNRVVRKASRPGLSGFYYELSHDSLAKVVFEERRRRLKLHGTLQLGFTILALGLLLFGVYAWRDLDLKEQAALKQTQAALRESSAALHVAEDALEATVFAEASERTTQDKATALQKLAAARDSLAQIAGATSPTPPEEDAEPVLRQAGEDRLRDPFTDGSGQTGPWLVAIPPGEFRMGSDSSGRDNERPTHGVSIAYPFHMTEKEVSRAEFAQFAAARSLTPADEEGCAAISDGVWTYDLKASWREPGFDQGPDHPVVCVSKQDTVDYAAWLSRNTEHCYRLPSESEWEFAARAGTTTRFWWGDRLVHGGANCVTCGAPPWSGQGTAPVGSFNPNPFGLFDTAGNVFEWVADCYHPSFDGAPADGSAWVSDGDVSCDERIIRGGGWLLGGDAMRSAYRQRVENPISSALIGIRLVRTKGACTAE